MYVRVMLAGIITQVLGTGFPVDEKLALASAILKPIETLVYRFGSFLFDGTVGEIRGGGVVNM